MTPDTIRTAKPTDQDATFILMRENVAIQAEIRDALLEIVKQAKSPRSIFEQTFGK